jgi:hypothetical protein
VDVNENTSSLATDQQSVVNHPAPQNIGGSTIKPGTECGGMSLRSKGVSALIADGKSWNSMPWKDPMVHITLMSWITSDRSLWEVRCGIVKICMSFVKSVIKLRQPGIWGRSPDGINIIQGALRSWRTIPAKLLLSNNFFKNVIK